MPRKKHLKLIEVNNLENVFIAENGANEENILSFFNNSNPLILEIGCGHGDYSINLGQLYPNKNFLGVDIKGGRLWTASKKATEQKVENVAFLKLRAELLTEFFIKTKIQEIWVTFPDTHPPRRNAFRRLISPNLVGVYNKVLVVGGKVNLKTDDENFYNFALETVSKPEYIIHQATADIYNETHITEEQLIKTKYEIDHLAKGRIIKFLSFSFKI